MEETKEVKFRDWYKVNMPQVPPPAVDTMYEAVKAGWMAAWEEQDKTLLECFFCGNKGELPDPPPLGVVAFVKCNNCGMALIVSGDKLHSNEKVRV